MTTLTRGHLSIKPVEVNTRIQLAHAVRDLTRNAEAAAAEAQVTEPRWGSITADDADLIGKRAARPPHGSEQIDANLAMPEANSPLLALRLYWFETDRQALEILGPEQPSEFHRLRAADVIFAQREADAGSSHLLLVTTRNRLALDRYVIPSIKKLYASIDDGAVVKSDTTQLTFGDDDIFRWIMARAHTQPAVGEGLTVPGVRSLNTEDDLTRASALSRGVDADRAELLALIATRARLGPAKFSISDDQLSLEADVELFPDGGFTVILGESWYRSEPLARDSIGPKIVPDLAFSVLPRLRLAYASDSHWRMGGRDDYIDRAVETLRSI